MVNLDALREALAPIGDVGIVEESFSIKGTLVTLRPLRPSQETEVQRWAGQVISDIESEDQASGIEYLDRFKIGCLSYAIVAIGDMDLREAEVIPTGKTLPNGTEIKVPKHKGLRDLLGDWTRPVLDACFRKFGEMMEKAEISVEKSVEFDPADLDSELARLTEKIARLNELKQRRVKGEVSSPLRDAVLDASNNTSAVAVGAPEEATQSTERRPVIPNAGNPIQRTETDVIRGPSSQEVLGTAPQTPTPAANEAAQAPQAPEVPQASPETANPDEVVVSATGSVSAPLPNEGWIDSSDSDSMAAAVAAENARLQAQRLKRTPPHLGAREAAHTVAPEVPVMNPTEVTAQPTTPRKSIQPETPELTSSRNPKFVPPKNR